MSSRMSWQLSRMICRRFSSNQMTRGYLSRNGYRSMEQAGVLQRCSQSQIQIGKVYYSNKSKIRPDDDDLSKPIKFSTSKASKVTAKENLSGDAMPDTPDWQPYVVVSSVAVFLLYFLYFREENDVDEYIAMPLWQKVPNLERQQLEVVLEYNLQHGIGTADIEKRLAELYAERDARKAQMAKKE